MATDQGPSALVVYQNAQGMRITFYIRPTGKTALKSGYRETGNLMAQYWSDHKYNYAIISPANDNQTAGVQKAVADYTANAPTV
jgi:anti-sigma factor RsiW